MDGKTKLRLLCQGVAFILLATVFFFEAATTHEQGKPGVWIYVSLGSMLVLMAIYYFYKSFEKTPSTPPK